MEYLIGLILAAAAICLATLIGLARERSFYPTVLIVIGLLCTVYCHGSFQPHTYG